MCMQFILYTSIQVVSKAYAIIAHFFQTFEYLSRPCIDSVLSRGFTQQDQLSGDNKNESEIKQFCFVVGKLNYTVKQKLITELDSADIQVYFEYRRQTTVSEFNQSLFKYI